MGSDWPRLLGSLVGSGKSLGGTMHEGWIGHRTSLDLDIEVRLQCFILLQSSWWIKMHVKVYLMNKWLSWDFPFCSKLIDAFASHTTKQSSSMTIAHGALPDEKNDPIMTWYTRFSATCIWCLMQGILCLIFTWHCQLSSAMYILQGPARYFIHIAMLVQWPLDKDWLPCWVHIIIRRGFDCW